MTTPDAAAVSRVADYAECLHRKCGYSKERAIEIAMKAWRTAAAVAEDGLGQVVYGAGPAGGISSIVPAGLVGAGVILSLLGNAKAGGFFSGVGIIIQILRS